MTVFYFPAGRPTAASTKTPTNFVVRINRGKNEIEHTGATLQEAVRAASRLAYLPVSEMRYLGAPLRAFTIDSRLKHFLKSNHLLLRFEMQPSEVTVEVCDDLWRPVKDNEGQPQRTGGTNFEGCLQVLKGNLDYSGVSKADLSKAVYPSPELVAVCPSPEFV